MSEVGSPTRRGPIIVGVVAALAVLALVIWLLVGGDESDGSDDPGASPSSESPTSGTGEPSDSPDPDETVTPSPGPTDVETPTERPGRPVRAPIDEPADLRNGVLVELVGIEAVQGQAEGPGETSGPSLRITIEVTNDSDDDIDLELALPTMYYGPDDTPAGDLAGPGVEPLRGTLAPGESASGRYVFNVPTDARDQVRVEFTYDLSAPKAIFTGSAS